MTLLLDTHVWLWAVEAPEKLGRRTKALLFDSGNERFFCAISALEIARLCLDERLIFSVSPKTWIEDSARDLQPSTRGTFCISLVVDGLGHTNQSRHQDGPARSCPAQASLLASHVSPEVLVFFLCSTRNCNIAVL